MDEYFLSRRVLVMEVGGGQVWGRPRLGWIDGRRRPWAAEG